MFSIKKFGAWIVTVAIASASLISLFPSKVSADITASDITLSPGNIIYYDMGYSVDLPVTRFGFTPCIDLYVSNIGYFSSIHVKYSSTLEYNSFNEISQKGIIFGYSTKDGLVHRRIGKDDLKEEYYDENGYLIPGYYNIMFSDGNTTGSIFYEVTGDEADGVYDGSYDASIIFNPGTKTDDGYVYGYTQEITTTLEGYNEEAYWNLYYSDMEITRNSIADLKTNKSSVKWDSNLISSQYFDEYGCLIPGRYIIECKDYNSSIIASEVITITQDINDGDYDRYTSSSLSIVMGNPASIATPNGNVAIKCIGTTNSLNAQLFGYTGNLSWNLSYKPVQDNNDYQWTRRDVIVSLGNNISSISFPAGATGNYDSAKNSYIPGMYMISAIDPDGFTIASAMIQVTGQSFDGAYPSATPTPTVVPQAETPTITQTPTVPTTVPTQSTPTPSTNDSGVAGFVERLYTIALARNSEPTGKANWINTLMTGTTGADAAKGFLFSDEFLNKNMSDRAFVTTLYRTFFDREPDAAGLTAWINALKNGTSKEDVIMGFIDSTEWANVCLRYGIPSGGNGVANITVEPNENIIAFATRLYTTCMNRTPDQAGLMAWARQLANLNDTGTNAAHGFFFSEEFLAQDIPDAEFVNRLYLTFMDRSPDYGGKKAWVEQLQAGVSREEVFQGFAQSDEFGSICATYGIIR